MRCNTSIFAIAISIDNQHLFNYHQSMKSRWTDNTALYKHFSQMFAQSFKQSRTSVLTA